MAQRFDPVLPCGVTVGERVQDEWILDAQRAEIVGVAAQHRSERRTFLLFHYMC